MPTSLKKARSLSKSPARKSSNGATSVKSTKADQRKTISWEEVQKHTSADDCWLVLGNKVYDVTAFVPKHPGGDHIVLSSGRDVTRLFETYHPLYVWSMKDKYEIGVVSDEGKPEPVEPVFEARTDFYPVLKKRVENFLAREKINPRDSPAFYLKALIVMSCYALSLILCTFVFPGNYWGIVPSAILWGVSGVSIGICIMHDGNHGAVSNKSWISRAFGYTLDLIGASSFIWHYQHNIGHHQHPNVPEHDPDIGFGSRIVRFSPAQEWKPIHRWQYLYLPPLYGFHLIKWHINDFITLMRGRIFNTMLNKITILGLIIFLLGKAFHFSVFFVLPRMAGLPWSQVWAQFLIAEAAAGYWSTVMFAVGHLTADTKWPYFNKKTGEIDGDFAVHQVIASTGYAHDSWFWNWISGGLNYQIEHHLFPSICHVHYPMIAPIVKETCKEYGIEYTYYATFTDALRAHFALLYRMGNPVDSDSKKKSKKE